MVTRFTNNVLSTAQQVWLRKGGGASPAVSENANGIISAGRAKRLGSQPGQSGDRLVFKSCCIFSFSSFRRLPYDNNDI